MANMQKSIPNGNMAEKPKRLIFSASHSTAVKADETKSSA